MRLRTALIPVVLLGLLLAILPAGGQPDVPEQPDAGWEKLRLKLNPELPAWSPAYVVERVAEHLSVMHKYFAADFLASGLDLRSAEKKATEEIAYMRFFDLSGVPRNRLPEATASLLFTVNSASAGPVVERPRVVPNTDNRLYWIDLRWYCWTPEVFEKISAEDPYFREPLIPSNSRGLSHMKSLIGNGVVRSDWFVYYTGDATQFLASGATQADNAFYYQLLYSYSTAEKEVETEVETSTDETYETGRMVEKTWPGGPDLKGTVFPKGYKYMEKEYGTRKVVKKEKKTIKQKVGGTIPKTTDEFFKFWGVDEKQARKRYADRGVVVDEGESYVSYQNRVLRRIQGSGGVLWQTYDVLRTAGDQDFLETLPVPPTKFDAAEIIFQDMKGAQYYLLTNGEGQRVEFGDPRVVHDTMSGEKGIVLTWKSCVACHVEGIITPKNEVSSIIRSGVKLNTNIQTKQQIQSFYLSNIQRLVKNDQEAYKDFIKECNGLSGDENAEQFKKHRLWYIAPLSLEQAARECGSNPQEFSDAISLSTKGRIGRLVIDGKPIPRTTWERGGYQEAFLLLIEYRKAVQEDRKMRGLPPLPISP